MGMLDAQTNELPKENQDSHLHNLEVLEKLEKEAELLIQEKEGFMEAEEQLWLRISVAIENRKQKNKELKQEVEQLRRKCDELTRVLNRSNISQL
jgi:hypothetical protein